MTRTLVSERARAVALLFAAMCLAALTFAVSAPRPNVLHAGAATAGVVHFEMKVTGQKTGVFKGDSTLKGHEDQITLSAYTFGIDSPRDPATGQATGKRQFKPLTVTKQMNASSPQVLNAISTNENLKSVVINFFRTDKAGKEVNFYRITLTNASISTVRQYSSGDTVLEDVSFTFQKIEQRDLIAGTIWLDEWRSVA